MLISDSYVNLKIGKMSANKGPVIESMKPDEGLPDASTTETKEKSTKKLIAIIISVFAIILLCANWFIALSTIYASMSLSAIGRCSPALSPEKNYTGPETFMTDPSSPPDRNSKAALDTFLSYLMIRNIIDLLVSIGYSGYLLFFFLAVGDRGLILIRKNIIVFGIIGAILFIVLESGLIYLTSSVFTLGNISKMGEAEYILKLSFKILSAPHISYCLVEDPTISIYWKQEMVIAPPVLTFITFTMIAVLIYLKVSMTNSSSRPTVATAEEGRTDQSSTEVKKIAEINRFPPLQITMSNPTFSFIFNDISTSNNTIIGLGFQDSIEISDQQQSTSVVIENDCEETITPASSSQKRPPVGKLKASQLAPFMIQSA